jgi:hypothetical protein
MPSTIDISEFIAENLIIFSVSNQRGKNPAAKQEDPLKTKKPRLRSA